MLKIIKKAILKCLKIRHDKNQERISQKLLLSEAEIAQVDFSHFLRDSFWILIGIASAGFGLKGFLLPNGFTWCSLQYMYKLYKSYRLDFTLN